MSGCGRISFGKRNGSSDMLTARTPILEPFSVPSPHDIKHGRQTRTAVLAQPARDGLIVGRVGNEWPLLYVNAVSYRGLLAAAEFADRLGKRQHAVRWRIRLTHWGKAGSGSFHWSPLRRPFCPSLPGLRSVPRPAALVWTTIARLSAAVLTIWVLRGNWPAAIRHYGRGSRKPYGPRFANSGIIRHPRPLYLGCPAACDRGSRRWLAISQEDGTMSR